MSKKEDFLFSNSFNLFDIIGLNKEARKGGIIRLNLRLIK